MMILPFHQTWPLENPPKTGALNGKINYEWRILFFAMFDFQRVYGVMGYTYPMYSGSQSIVEIPTNQPEIHSMTEGFEHC